MGDSPIYHLPWPELSDPADVPAAMQDTAMATDGILNTFHTETQADLDDMQGQITGATGSFVKLGHVDLAAPAAQVDFAAIPQTYDHLMVMAALRGTTAALQESFMMRFNGDASANYTTHYVSGSNNTVVGGSNVGQSGAYIGAMAAASAPAQHSGVVVVFIPGYRIVTARQWVSLSQMTVGLTVAQIYAQFRGGFYNVSAGCTGVRLVPATGSFAAGGKVSLYGVKGA